MRDRSQNLCKEPVSSTRSDSCSRHLAARRYSRLPAKRHSIRSLIKPAPRQIDPSANRPLGKSAPRQISSPANRPLGKPAPRQISSSANRPLGKPAPRQIGTPAVDKQTLATMGLLCPHCHCIYSSNRADRASIAAVSASSNRPFCSELRAKIE